MSISITTTSEWFRCIGPTAASAERRTALARLVRMLAGDAARPPPQISLPGRPAAAPPPATVPAVPAVRYFRQALPTGKAINTPSKDTDAHPPYSCKQLERMNTRFVERLERAIARGRERSHA